MSILSELCEVRYRGYGGRERELSEATDKICKEFFVPLKPAMKILIKDALRFASAYAIGEVDVMLEALGRARNDNPKGGD